MADQKKPDQSDEKKHSALGALFDRLTPEQLAAELSPDQIGKMIDKLDQAKTAKDDDVPLEKMSHEEFQRYSDRMMSKEG